MLLFVLLVTLVRHVVTLSAANLENEITSFVSAINRALGFCDEHSDEINLDGLLGITLAEANLEMLVMEMEGNLVDYLQNLLDRIKTVKRRIKRQNSPKNYRDVLFNYYLLQPKFWFNNVKFEYGLLEDYGTYSYPEYNQIFQIKSAIFHGIPTDVCLVEILEQGKKDNEMHSCKISPTCQKIMLENRNDTSYLLTHRLFYLQIGRGARCFRNNQKAYAHYCSLMLKEVKSNELYGFPQHDIFLEQVLFCGMEGFSEFLVPRWRQQVLSWQTREGCYKNRGQDKYFRFNRRLIARDENIISYGCTDHTTGLGIAVLALNLRYLINVMSSFFM